MMFRAEEWDLRERGTNPCLSKNKRSNIARFLNADELARLGCTLDVREAQWREAVAAIRLLALSGCRRSEMLNLRWSNIGTDAINLPDSKTGPRAVPLGEAARASRRSPASGCRVRSYSLATPKAGAPTALQLSGGQFAPKRSLAGCGCMT